MPIQELDNVEAAINEVADCFEDTMKQLFDEDPGLFEGHSTQMEWSSQVSFAGDELREALGALIEKFEVRLHNGEFA
tara:strand:- start:906 stop:1136 length:231 start_codon:yes stop_codon:yes gene_type:complete